MSRFEPIVVTAVCLGFAAFGALGLIIGAIGAIHQRWCEFRDAQIEALEDRGATMFHGEDQRT